MGKNCLIRIDDRLIHGQVVIGWCKALGISKLVLCDEEIAGSEFEQELYLCCPEKDQDLMFLNARECAEHLNHNGKEKTIVVMSSPEQALRLCDAGYQPADITIGGLHDKPGAHRLLDYVYVTAGEEHELRSLQDRGIHIQCRSLPGSTLTELTSLL